MQSELVKISEVKKYSCNTCNSEFTSKKADKNRVPKFCTKECYAESIKKYKKCNHCGVAFADYKKKVFCSKSCHTESRKNKQLPSEWKKALSDGRKNSEKCKGENLYNWKGGKSTEAIRVKQSFYKRKRGLKERMPITFLNRLLVVQDNKCFFCETNLSEYKAIEHLTPVSKGGDNFTYNLVYSCKSCNSKKRQNTLEEFAIKNKRFDWLDKFDIIYAGAIG
jgi:hypothetical protein